MKNKLPRKTNWWDSEKILKEVEAQVARLDSDQSAKRDAERRIRFLVNDRCSIDEVREILRAIPQKCFPLDNRTE